jgi:manganese transport protein
MTERRRCSGSRIARRCWRSVSPASSTWRWSQLAAQVVMQGSVGFRIPLWLGRLVTMVPSFVVVALGVDAIQVLILSQVVLSLILPIPMIALLILRRSRGVMGSYANGRLTMATAIAAAAVVLVLNLLLVLQIAGVPLPALAAIG